MEAKKSNGRRWRVGELAEATGLTVRTLHHYEHIGLFTPAERTEGHQRLYDQHDIERLYRIRALRDLGLSLAEIQEMLDGEGGTLGGVLRAHMARVDAELERLRQLRTLLERASAQADRIVDTDDVLAAIEAMSRVVRRADARSNEAGAGEDMGARWRAIGDELRACMNEGEPPSSERVRAIACDAQARLVEFAGGDPATLDALARLRRLDPPENLAGWDPELMRYLDEALSALRDLEDEPC